VIEDAVTKRSDKLWRHVLGSAKFEEIYNDKDALYDIEIAKTRDRQYLFLQSEPRILPKRATCAPTARGDFTVFLPREKGHRYYLDHREGLFYIRTNRSGRNFAVMTAPVDSPAPKSWKVFVAHRDNVRIQDIDLFKDFAVSVERAMRWTTCVSIISKPAPGRKSRIPSPCIRSSGRHAGL